MSEDQCQNKQTKQSLTDFYLEINSELTQFLIFNEIFEITQVKCTIHKKILTLCIIYIYIYVK